MYGNGWPGIDRERREHREDFRLEIRIQRGALVRRHLVDRHDPDAGGIELRDQDFVQALPTPLERLANALVNRLERRVRSQTIRSRDLDARRHLPPQGSQPDHVELVQVRAEDREEFQPLEQRSAIVFSLLQNAAVELQPRELAIQEEGRRDRGRGHVGGWDGRDLLHRAAADEMKYRAPRLTR